MNPQLANALTILLGAIATFIVLAARYYFGQGRRNKNCPHQDQDTDSPDS